MQTLADLAGTFELVVVPQDQLEEVLGSGLRELRPLGGHPELDVLRVRLARNPRCVTRVVVSGENSDEQRNVGYFVIYPLTSAAARKIQEGRARSGRELCSEDIAVDDEAPSAFYVSVVWSTGGTAGAATLAGMARWLLNADRRISEEASGLWIFGRPATPAGHRVMTRLGMRPVRDPSDIWQVMLPRGTRRSG